MLIAEKESKNTNVTNRIYEIKIVNEFSTYTKMVCMTSVFLLTGLIKSLLRGNSETVIRHSNTHYCWAQF